MADKPSLYPSWATSDLDEVRIIDDAPVILSNKVEPTAEWKASGELYRENLPRPYVNYQFNLLDSWVKNLDERTSLVGTVQLTTNAAETITTLASRFGGTWTARGNTTLGTSPTTYVFERTA
jgi:hypothetical protein